MLSKNPFYNSMLIAGGLSLALSGCLGGDEKKKDEVASEPLTEITSEADAQKAAGTVSDTDNIDNSMDSVDIDGVMDEMLSLAGTSAKLPNQTKKFAGNPKAVKALKKSLKALKPVLAKSVTAKVKAKSLADGAELLVSQTIACDVSGDITIADSRSSATSGTLTITFNECRDDHISYQEVTNGKIVLSGSGSENASYSFTLTVGDGNTTVGGVDSTSDVRTVTYDPDGVMLGWDISSGVFTMGGSVIKDSAGSPTGFNLTYKANAGFSSLIEGVKETGTIRNFSLISKNSYTDYFDSDDTVDGVFEGTLDETNDGVVDETEYLGFNNLHLVFSYPSQSDFSTLTWEINGKIVSTHTPAECGDGSYQVVTNLAFSREAGVLVAGKMTINSSTVIEVLNPGMLTITVAGGTPTEVAEDQADSVCLL